jgi:hypothetical protein
MRWCECDGERPRSDCTPSRFFEHQCVTRRSVERGRWRKLLFSSRFGVERATAESALLTVAEVL